MKDRLKIMGITSLIIANNAFGISCPNVKNAPLCPSSGSTLLDETYPTQAFVISNSPMSKGLQSDKVTSEYISKIAKSYDYENMPQVLVPVTSEDDFKQVVEKVKTSLQNNNVKADKIEKVLSQISHVRNDSYTWQQDYFESFTDLKTGTPVLREFQSYITSRPVTAFAVDKMQEAGKACNIAKGETLVSQHIDYVSDKKNGSDLSFESGEMGGNVEGAPGGFCLTGDNHSKKLSTQYCGKEENIIQLQTSWLSVGHVDEIFKIIPSKFNDRRPAECQFSLMSASPKKALELMNSSKNKAK
ncbi:MAG: hypothetical protein EHM20_03870 [Alphaproteobacteria bacterium]|nr:MAG: hypothetical protein EHM20_03870 [Alphaproteobacteria bacterium]